MRVDAHHHLWDLAVRDQDWTRDMPILHRTYSLAEFRPALTEAGIDRTVLVQTVALPDETRDFLGLAAGIGSDVVAGVVGWVDLTASDVADRLAELRDLPAGGKLVGVRHLVQDEPDPRWLRREDVQRGLAAVADADLAYDLLVRSPQLPAAVETVHDLPQLRFVLDHLAKPPIASGDLEPWRTDLMKLAALPNVAVKLSGMVTEADLQAWTVGDLRPYADTVLDAFGPERAMFGSDWPVCLLAASYAQVVDAAEQLTMQLSDGERQAIFGATAVRWYGLPVTD